MQVEETRNEGLTRQYSITVPADEIEDKVTARLSEIGKTVKMPGFRPGKVPLQLLRKQYGPSVMGEVLERAISETSAETLRDKDVRPAMQPRVEITDFKEGGDLTYTITVELMPEIGRIDFSGLKVDRLRVDVTDEMVNEALGRIAQEQRKYEKTDEDRPATEEDALLVDFTGKVDGEEFPGGSAKDFQLELSSQSFIPGFVEQMKGAKPGEKRTVKVTFPQEFGSPDLAGKEAEFDVEVKELRARVPVEVGEDMAKSMGFESLDAMKGAIRERLDSEYGSIARMRLKREVLDKLAEIADFEIPEGMVEHEFHEIWSTLAGEPAHEHAEGEGAQEHEHEHRTDPAAQARFQQYLKDTGKSEAEVAEEYRQIAARRVRLGLLLAETGRANDISVSDEELNRAVVNEAQRFPGQERQVIEYYQKDRAALEQLRAPLFEDKVIDFILELADVTERKVSADELMADPDEDEEGAAEEGGKPARKASGGKKSAGGGKKALKKAGAGKKETEE